MASNVAILPLNSCGFLGPHTYANVGKVPEAGHQHKPRKYLNQATNTNFVQYLKEATNMVQYQKKATNIVQYLKEATNTNIVQYLKEATNTFSFLIIL